MRYEEGITGMIIKREKAEKDRYFVMLMLFLAAFHLLLNRYVRIISFSTDEFIPVAVAAHYSGLDWMNARKFNYYYGYLTLVFFIPFFKIPFVYRNPFLLTQCLAGINTFFYLAQAAFLYKSVNLLGDFRNRKQAFWITLAGMCCLQVFNIGFGAQVEGLFCLSYMIVFYCFIQFAKGRENSLTPVIMAVFTGTAMINNSRGIVLLIASVMVLCLQLCSDRRMKKPILLYVTGTALIMCVHQYVVKPSYMQFFMTGAANTDSGSLLGKLELVLTDPEYTKSFVRIVIGWIWALNVSTFGGFFISVIFICRKVSGALRLRKPEQMIIPAFIFLNIAGILALCGTMGVISAHDMFVLGEGSRADMVIYTRYFAAITSITIAYGLYGFLTDSVLTSRKEWRLLFGCSYLSCKLFQVLDAPGMDGFQYGVNNTVFPAMFLQYFQDSHRYGFVLAEKFLLLHVLLFCILLLMKWMQGKKELFLKFSAFLSIGVCIVYSVLIIGPRSDYYMTVFDEKIIEYCKNSDKMNIYAGGSMAPVMQYLLPDKKLYFQMDDQEILIVPFGKEKSVDRMRYREIITTSDWTVFEKIPGSFTKTPK